MKKKKTDIRFISKTVNPVNDLWVENYTEEEKQFFLTLGFKERVYNKGSMFEKGVLEFEGSEIFGFWSKDEKKKIFGAMNESFYKKYLIVQQDIPD